MKVKAAIKDYLAEIEIRKYTSTTIKSYKDKLSVYERFLIDEGINEIDDITQSTIKTFTQKMIRQGLKGTSINSVLKTVKSFTQYCYDEDFGGFNARRGGFKWVKEDKPVITAFTPKQVKKILDNCKGTDFRSLRDAAIVTMFFETGVRCIELRGIRSEDIHDDYIIINGKNHKQRVVPITPMLRKALMRYERVRESYFMDKNTEDNFFLSIRGRALTNTVLEQMLKKKGEGIEGVRVSPHTCRHFFAQQQVKMGTDVYTISRLLGHENISITQVYLNSLKDKEIIKLAKQKSVLMNM